MAKDLLIRLEARDNASAVFQRTGRAGREMGEEIERGADKASDALDDMERAQEEVGQSAVDMVLDVGKASDELGRDLPAAVDRAERSLEDLDRAQDEVGQSATEMGQDVDRAGTSIRDFESAGRTAAAGLALLGTSFVMYANQARDNEIAISNLRRTYGEATDSFIQLANTIQSTTIFSNDEAIQAAAIFGTLKRNYELTDQQIQQLIVTSADLAAVNGTTLTDAATRVAAAIRGEAESAEMLGLTMNQTAIDSENLTLSMSNAEAGAFRYNALMEQAEFATGAAGEQAETTAGEFQQLGNRVQDAATDFVEFTGPVGQAAMGLSTWGLEAGLALSGAVTLTKGVKDLTTAMKGLQATTAVTGGFSALSGLLGSSGLAAAIGAAGTAALLAAPAVITLGGAVYYLAQANKELHDDIDAQTDAISAWVAAMPDSIDHQNLTYFAQDVRDLGTSVAQWDPSTGADSVGEFKDAFDELLSLNPESLLILQEILAGYGMSLQDLSHIANDSDALGLIYQAIINVAIEQERAQAATDAYTGAMLENQDQMAQSSAMANTFAESTAESTTAVEDNTEAVTANTNAKLSNGNVVRDSEEALHQWAMAVSEGNTATETSTETTSEFTAELAALDAGMAAYISTLNERRAAEAALDQALVEWITDQVALNTALGVFSGNMETLPQRLNETAVAVERMQRAIGIAATEVERGQDLWTAYNDAASAVAETVGRVAFGIVDAASATGILSDTTGTILGQTNAWGSAAQSVADWASSLTDGRLAQTALDNALLDGIISRTTYQQALDANHRILVANAAIQEDILRIQIKQMPVMAQAIEQQAAYVDSVADLGPEAQLAALGFMDQAQAAKALEVAQLAAASATDAQKASTTAMIQEMVNADPVLKAMLLDMGLISEGANGTITVNFDDTVNATDAIEALNGTINDLILLLGDIFNVDTDTDAPATQELVRNLIGEIDRIPEQVTTNVFLNDYASLKAAEISDILNLLDGKTATTYINTVETRSLQLNNPFATGGTVPIDGRRVLDGVPAFAGGGTMALVGEAGPELVRLPVGSQVTSSPATRSQLATVARRGDTGVVFNGPVTLSVQRDGTAQEAIRRAALARTRGY